MDNGMSPGALAGLVEDYGQDAVFFAEHAHFPAGRKSPHHDAARGQL
jgi:hypothetical protein